MENNREVLLKVDHLCQYFRLGRKDLKAVDDVSFEIKKGEVFGLVGESGCGKTTTGRSIIKIYDITSGSIYFKGQRICAGTKAYKDEIKLQQSLIKELKKTNPADAAERIEAAKARIAELKIEIQKAKFDHNHSDREYAKRLVKKAEEDYAAKLEAAMPSIQISFQLNPETGRPMTFLNGENVEDRIRTMEVSTRVSPVAALPFVREALVKLQQEMGKEKGIVMDGRDIGTAVFPDAELKIFMTADPLVRARRRAEEMAVKGEDTDIELVLKNLQERDYIDSHRETSPLTKADDAIVLDNSYMTMEDQLEWLKKIISERFGA